MWNRAGHVPFAGTGEVAAALLLVASSLLAASGAFGQATFAAARMSLSVGPFVLGMSLDEVNCAVRVELERWSQPPVPQTFDTAKAQTRGQLSVAECHLVQGQRGEAPTTGP